MDENTREARDILDYMLFHNVFNMPEREPWEVTFKGDNYVMWNTDTNELFHFKVKIKQHDWDSSESRAEQEWDV